MQLTKTITMFAKGNYSQEVDITVEFDGEEVKEVLSVEATNLKRGIALNQPINIKEFLESQNALDPIIDNINWREVYCDEKAEQFVNH